MKATIRSLTAVSAVLFLSIGSTQAVDWSKFYINGDVGGMFQQDATWTQSSAGGHAQNITFNPGIRGDIGIGYNINDSWAAELETGVLWNSIDKVNSVHLDSINQSFDIYTVPLMANVIYKIPLKGSLTPYVGAGIGGAASIEDYTDPPVSGGDIDFNIACQAMAGLKYALTKHVSVGIGYRFLTTTGQGWYLSEIHDHIKTRDVYTHSVVASLTWNF